VVQGWQLADYLACVQLYRSAGVDLTRLPLTGLGSVCRRQSTGQIAVIVTTLASLGLRLHGFGIKTTGLHPYAHLLPSPPPRPSAPLRGVDALALCLAPRPRPARLARAPHLRELPGLRRRLAVTPPGRYYLSRLPGQPVRPGIPGGGGMTTVTAWRTDEPCPVC